MSHTPKPWWYDSHTECVGTPAGWVASLAGRERKSDVPFGDQEADARLIAAAPEMYEACKADTAFWDHYTDCQECNGTAFCIEAIGLAASARSARFAAIAKAEEEA